MRYQGRRKEWCGPACRKRTLYRLRPEVYAKSRARPAAEHNKRGRKSLRIEKACTTCGASFMARRTKPGLYCSWPCRATGVGLSRRAAPLVRSCSNCHLPFSVPSNHWDQLFCSRGCARDCARTERLGPPAPSACRHCGAFFLGRGVCSRDCRLAFELARSRRLSEAKHFRSPRACASCGKVFAPAYGEKRRRFCSRPCLLSVSSLKHIERARKYGCEYEPVNSVRVFKRDGWKCGICGGQTLPLMRGTNHDLAPELDHIVPISLKGPHTYANVQCSHRKCNIQKGARGAAAA